MTRAIDAANGNVNLPDDLHPVRGGSCQHVHDARSGADPGQCETIRPFPLGMPPQLLARLMKETSEIAVMNPGGECRLHHGQVEAMVRGIDDGKRGDASQQACKVPRSRGVRFDISDGDAPRHCSSDARRRLARHVSDDDSGAPGGSLGEIACGNLPHGARAKNDVGQPGISAAR